MLEIPYRRPDFPNHIASRASTLNPALKTGGLRGIKGACPPRIIGPPPGTAIDRGRRNPLVVHGFCRDKVAATCARSPHYGPSICGSVGVRNKARREA